MSVFPEVSFPSVCWAFSSEACLKWECAALSTCAGVLLLSPPQATPLAENRIRPGGPTPAPRLLFGTEGGAGCKWQALCASSAAPGVGFTSAAAPSRAHRCLFAFGPQAPCAFSSPLGKRTVLLRTVCLRLRSVQPQACALAAGCAPGLGLFLHSRAVASAPMAGLFCSMYLVCKHDLLPPPPSPSFPSQKYLSIIAIIWSSESYLKPELKASCPEIRS